MFNKKWEWEKYIGKEPEVINIEGSNCYDGQYILNNPKQRNTKILITLFVGIILGLAL